MAQIFVSGLINVETTVRVRQFPVPYYPVDYPFFGVNTSVSGVAYNIAKALRTLGDPVILSSLSGCDFSAEYIKSELLKNGMSIERIRSGLEATPSSVVLYDEEGKRQIYCDLKDIQEADYGFVRNDLEDVDLVVACNINFNRPLLRLARTAGKTIATDVHVLSNVWDEYNREFMENAHILFLSDEGIGQEYEDFLWQLAQTYPSEIIVLGRGSKGAAMYLRQENRMYEFPSVSVGPVVNTVGAGDALFSGFLHFYHRGDHPVEALHRAQIFAAAKIRSNGASNGFVTEEQIEGWYGDVVK